MSTIHSQPSERFVALLAAIAMLLMPVGALAEVEFSATVSTATIVIGQTVEWHLSLWGRRSALASFPRDPEPELPVMQDWRQVRQDVRTGVALDLGHTVRGGESFDHRDEQCVVTLSVTQAPTRTGTLTIQPVSLHIGGKHYVTVPLSVTVLPDDPMSSIQPPADGAAAFVEVTLDKKQVFVGEADTLSTYLFAKGVDLALTDRSAKLLRNSGGRSS